MELMSARQVAAVPYYAAQGGECTLFEQAHASRLPLLIKGPTGCGKTRFVEHMAARLGRPLVTVSCHDDLSAADLVGRHLIAGGDTLWCDGPLTRAVREGAILYLDEVAEAREDVVVLLHPLTDHRRQRFVDRNDEVLVAPSNFMVVASFNPGSGAGSKSSSRRRGSGSCRCSSGTRPKTSRSRC